MPPRPDSAPGAHRRFVPAGTVEGPGATLATGSLPTLPELLALDEGARAAARGVRLAPGDALEDLLPELDRLDLVAVEFPAFTDGRGFSHARRLRRVHGFAGELRAVGDVRPDQARQMLACGIDALEFAEPPDPALLERLVNRLPAGYQPSYRRVADVVPGRAGA